MGEDFVDLPGREMMEERLAIVTDAGGCELDDLYPAISQRLAGQSMTIDQVVFELEEAIFWFGAEKKLSPQAVRSLLDPKTFDEFLLVLIEDADLRHLAVAYSHLAA